MAGLGFRAVLLSGALTFGVVGEAAAGTLSAPISGVATVVAVSPPVGAPSQINPSFTVTYAGTAGDAAQVTGTSLTASFNSNDLSYVSASGAGWSCTPSAGVVFCSGPDIPLGQQRAVALLFNVRNFGGSAPSQIIATPAGTVASGTLTTAPASANFEITNRVDFQLSGGGDFAIPQGGQQALTFQVARNAGDANAPANLWQGLRVNFSFPSQLRYLGGAASGWTCTAASPTPGGSFQCTRASNSPSATPESIVLQAQGVTVVSTPVQVSGQLLQDSPEPSVGNNSSASNLTVVAVDADVGVAAQVVGVPVNGQDFTLRLTASNAGPATASTIVIDVSTAAGLQITLPAGCTVQSPTATRCAIASLGAGGSQVIDLIARHTAPRPPGGILNNSASIAAAEADPNPSNNSVVIPVSLQAAADLSVLLTDSVDPVPFGEEFVLGVLAQNLGPDGASSVSVLVNLPGAAEFVGFATASGAGTPLSCSGGNGGSSVLCAASALIAGESARASIRLRAPSTATVLSSTATISAGSGTVDPQTTNNSDSESTTVDGGAVLSLTKRASGSQIAVGSEFSYTLNVRNAGRGNQSGVVVLDTLPAGQTPLSASGPGFSCTISGQTVDCRTLSLPMGSAVDLVINARAPTAPGTAINTATAQSVQVQTPQGASAQVDFVVAASIIDLVLDKRDSQDPVGANAAFDYQLVVSNAGTDAASGITLTDTLPAGLTVTGFAGAGWSCTGVGGPSISCSLSGSLAAGASSTVTLSARAPSQATVLNNRATVQPLAGETNTADNTDSESTTVQTGGPNTGVDLELTGSLQAQTAAVGQEVPFTLVVRNVNSSTGVANASLCGSAVPSGTAFQLLSLTGAGSNCSVGGGGTISCAIPTLGAGQSLTLAGVGRVGTVAVGSSVGLDADIGCNRLDPDSGNNTVTLRATVAAVSTAGADLAVSLLDSADPVQSGARFDYIAEVRNAGLGVANAPQLAFTLGSSLTYRGFNGAGWSCNGNGTSVNCQSQAPLAVQARGTVTINVEATGPTGSFETVVQVSSTTSDPVAANNRATQSTSIGSSTDPNVIEGQLTPATLNDPFAGAAAPVVADICANPVADLAPQCQALINAALSGNTSGVADGLRALFPEEVIAQSVSLNQAAATQFSNVDARLNEARGGSGGFSVSGLALGMGRQALPLSVFKSLLGEEDEPAIGESGELISRWGGFINGTLSRGEQDVGNGSRRVVSDFNSYGLTAGVDYRRSTRWIIGAALGYADFSSDLADGGGLSTKGFTLTGYTSWYPRDLLYVDARLSFARMDLELDRRINFSSGNFTLDRLARGSTESDQLTFAASSGYHISRGMWSFTPNAAVRYVNSQVDGFTETGAGANNATFSDQDIDSLQFSFGLQVTRVISLSNGVLTPQFDISYGRETRGDDLVIEARLAGAAADQVFRVEAEDPDQSFGNVGLGLVYIAANGKQFYMSYRELLGVEGLERGSLTLGGRFEF